MKRVFLTRLFLLAITALFALPALKADTINVTLTPVRLAGAPGSSILFTGVLENQSGATVYLNSAGGDLSYFELTLDVTPFFTSAPLSLDDGTFYSGPLFAVAISNVALPGTYSGQFTLAGGPDPESFDNIGSAAFEVTVVPEPPSIFLLGIGTLLLLPTVLTCRQS